MDYLSHIVYGALIAFIGMVPPGMLNMTALKIRMERGRPESYKYAFGATSIIFFQAAVAVVFADFFIKNPFVIDYLRLIGIVVFFILAGVFYALSKREINIDSEEQKPKGKYFMRGAGMSALNMLAVPFYLAIAMYLASESKLILEPTYKFLFAIGAALGAAILFYIYISSSNLISRKASFIARNINIILSVLFLVLAVLGVFRYMS